MPKQKADALASALILTADSRWLKAYLIALTRLPSRDL